MINNLLKGAFFLILAFIAQPLAAQQRPNIVLILADDLGYADLSCYGNPVIETPFLDQMAAKGVRATNYAVTSPSCSPSRGSLLTGRYPTRFNIPSPLAPGQKQGLAASEVTLAEMLKARGYKTAMVGKWHLGDHYENLPMQQGFEQYYGMLYSHDYHSPYVKTDSTLKIYRGNKAEIIQPADSSLTNLYGKEAISFIKKQKASQPFFLYLAYNMPHLPVWYAAQKNKNNLEKGGELGFVINEMDKSIAAVWKAIEQQGFAKNTIFIFSSDNGPWSNYPDRMSEDHVTKRNHAGYAGIFRGSKGTSYEGGDRVPFIFYWAGQTQPTVLKKPVTCLDILPTLANITGSTLPKGQTLDGENVRSLLTGKSYSSHQPFYYVNNGIPEAVRDGIWKLRRIKEKNETSIELFNLEADPAERVDLKADYPELTAKLMAKLDQYPYGKN